MPFSPSRRVRVLQVVISLVPGGTERLVLEIARRSAAACDTAVCCLEVAGAWGEELRSQGFRVDALERRPGFHPSLGRRIAAIARDHQADVLHCHQYSPFVYGCLSRLSYRGARLLFTEHGRLAGQQPSPKRRRANRLLARLAHGTFAVSSDLKRHMIAEGFGADRVEVVPNGIDPGELPRPADRSAVRAALGVDQTAFVVGSVARLDPVKDIGTLLDATARLSGDVANARLLLVGDGEERQALERHAARLGLRDRVLFLGHRDDARRVLAACDVFANSSVFEGVSLTILEAMAAGLPVVATAVGGTPEIVDDRCGILVPAKDPAAMAAALARLAAAPQVRLQMGASGRAAVEERFSLDRMVGRYVALYRNEQWTMHNEQQFIPRSGP